MMWARIRSETLLVLNRQESYRWTVTILPVLALHKIYPVLVPSFVLLDKVLQGKSLRNRVTKPRFAKFVDVFNQDSS